MYHLAKHPEWDKALNTLQYAGERAFKSEKRRDTLRDSGDLVARVRGLYLEQRWDSRTHKQAVSVVCETLDLNAAVLMHGQPNSAGSGMYEL